MMPRSQPMRRKSRAKDHVPVDKSMLQIGIVPRLVDEAYQRCARDQECMVCWLKGRLAQPGTVVLAHVNLAELGAGAHRKSDDRFGLFLCNWCHVDGDDALDRSADRCRWLVIHVLAPLLARGYERIKEAA